jgi:hypothetical protein
MEGSPLSDGIYFVLGTPNSQSQCYSSLRTIYFEPASFQVEQDFSHNVKAIHLPGKEKTGLCLKYLLIQKSLFLTTEV